MGEFYWRWSTGQLGTRSVRLYGARLTSRKIRIRIVSEGANYCHWPGNLVRSRNYTRNSWWGFLRGEAVFRLDGRCKMVLIGSVWYLLLVRPCGHLCSRVYQTFLLRSRGPRVRTYTNSGWLLCAQNLIPTGYLFLIRGSISIMKGISDIDDI